MSRCAMVALLVLAAAACGSVGGGSKTGSGGTDVTTGGSGGSSASGGTGGSDASAGSDARTDAADAGPLPASCQAIKQQNPSAASGLFTIAPLGMAQQSFCEMLSDGGGWTAFYVGVNGSAPGGAHFETAADACPDPANSCLRRLPVTIDETHDFAVKCDAAVVKFKIPASTTAGTLTPVLDYFKNGLTHSWQTVSNAVTIDINSVGQSNLVSYVWTGDGTTNRGWIATSGTSTADIGNAGTFANGYTLNAGWNFCNGAANNSSRVMLFYR